MSNQPTNESKEKNILCSCSDLTIAFDTATTIAEKTELISELISLLASYPNPKRKYTTNQKSYEEIKYTPRYLQGAYLFVLMSRNALQLALLGYIDYNNAMQLASSNIETAFHQLND